MELTEKQIIIVGCGPGCAALVHRAAEGAARQATILVGSQRLLSLFPEHRGRQVVVGADITAVLDQIAANCHEQVVVLVSGDPGVCSLAKPVLRRFGHSACRVIPGISSIQVAFAAIGAEWYDARIISAHAGVPGVLPAALQNEPKLAVLGGGRRARPWVRELVRQLAATHTVYLMENLSLEDQRVIEIDYDGFDQLEIASKVIYVFIQKGLTL